LTYAIDHAKISALNRYAVNDALLCALEGKALVVLLRFDPVFLEDVQ